MLVGTIVDGRADMMVETETTLAELRKL